MKHDDLARRLVQDCHDDNYVGEWSAITLSSVDWALQCTGVCHLYVCVCVSSQGQSVPDAGTVVGLVC